jgi:hypothetical protein
LQLIQRHLAGCAQRKSQDKTRDHKSRILAAFAASPEGSGKSIPLNCLQRPRPNARWREALPAARIPWEQSDGSSIVRRTPQSFVVVDALVPR